MMRRSELERLFTKALRELDLSARVQAALPAPPRAPARVIAIGKAAPAMAAGALERWGDAVESCLVVMPDGTDTKRLEQDERVRVLCASHPLPDARSVVAARACLAAVTTAEQRTVLVLVSGGASALVCAPADGIALRDKRAITRVMLESGASVQDVNVVRKHLSSIKGGGLARAAGRNRVLTIVASDVIGGAAADVGSGPSVPDATTPAAARRLLRRYAPAFADVPLAKTLAPSAPVARRLRAKIVASPEELARVVARMLRDRSSVDVRLLRASQSPAEELAAEYVVLAARNKGPRAFVRAAEPTLTVPSRAGRGGRSSHVAALVGRAIAGRRVLFGAFATDGVDGGSGTAGASVDGHFAERVAAHLGASSLDRAIAAFDTGTLHRAVATAVLSPPTGHNLADLHILVVD